MSKEIKRNHQNKVYYGEYSLDYWIALILSRNIILPDYQRNYSWDEEKRKKLIESLKKGEFVPPVIIGSFSKSEGKQNLLIDGQQRLTSILLSVLGYFPDREKYKKNLRKMKNALDENDDMSSDDKPTDVINWSFNDLLNDKVSTIKTIQAKLEKNDSFKSLNNSDEITQDFLETTFLGFSYLVPSNDEKGAQQKYYSSVFRNINRQGMSLTGQESREALYYLDESKTDFFKPKFVESLGGSVSIDFIRYLSILSQYKKEGSSQNLCKGFGGRQEKLEGYYEEYIKFIIDTDSDSNSNSNKTDGLFLTYKELFNQSTRNKPHEGYTTKIERFVKETPLMEKEFESIIDCDLYYFGLIYWTVFEGGNINSDNWNLLSRKLEEKIKEYKSPYIDINMNPTYDYDDKNKLNFHQKNPSALKFIKERLDSSINIYKEFVTNHE